MCLRLLFLYWTCRAELTSLINIKQCFVCALWQKCPHGVICILKTWEAFNALWSSVKVVWIEHLVSNLWIHQFLQVFGPALGLCFVPALHSLSCFLVSRANRGWFIAWRFVGVWQLVEQKEYKNHFGICGVEMATLTTSPWKAFYLSSRWWRRKSSCPET